MNEVSNARPRAMQLVAPCMNQLPAVDLEHIFNNQVLRGYFHHAFVFLFRAVSLNLLGLLCCLPIDLSQ